jgi:hypothetical protein
MFLVCLRLFGVQGEVVWPLGPEAASGRCRSAMLEFKNDVFFFTQTFLKLPW